MPYTDFHYTPTGTGVISGKEVLEQTEDAINDLGTQISGDVQTAIDTANNALNVANTASADAQNAVNTANTAYTAATNAQNTANAAQNTASNALTAAQNAQNDVNALGNRVTTAENNITQNTTDISGLTTRMGTAEGNITTLQNDVITAQGTATSAQNTATMARQQAYVLRYSSTAITDNSTIAYSTLDNTDNIKADDKIIDVDGKIFSIVSVDSDNSTVTVGSALIDLATDSDVVHKSGNETIAGIKSFSDYTYIRALNFTNEVASPSSSGSAVMPIVTTVTYTDSSPSQSARLNFRITADGIKSLYPHENNQYALGLQSRKWSEVRALQYYYGSSDTEFSDKFVTTDTAQSITGIKTFSDDISVRMLTATGKYISDEGSSNRRTVLKLLAGTRDTDGYSCSYVTRVRPNKAQGALISSDVQTLGFDFVENQVRTINTFVIRATNWLNDIPTKIEFTSNISDNTFGSSSNKCKINDLNPGSLSFPDLNNGLDISGFITTGSSTNDSYTAPADGYLAIIMASSSACGCYVYNYTDGVFMRSNSITDSTYTNVCGCFIPILKNQTLNISTRSTESIVSAKFYPCQGNV